MKTRISLIAVLGACGLIVSSGPAMGADGDEGSRESEKRPLARIEFLPGTGPSVSAFGGAMMNGASGGIGGLELKRPLNSRGTAARLLLGGMVSKFNERERTGPDGREYNMTIALFPIGLEQNLLSVSLGRSGKAVAFVPRAGAGMALIGINCTSRVTDTRSDCRRATWSPSPYVSAGVDVKVPLKDHGFINLGFDWGNAVDMETRKTMQYRGAHLGLAFDGMRLLGE